MIGRSTIKQVSQLGLMLIISTLILFQSKSLQAKICTQKEIKDYLTQIEQVEQDSAEAQAVVDSVIDCSQSAIPLLTDALNSQSDKVRAGAAYALGNLGRDAKPAISVLLEKLVDPSRDVRYQATFALGVIGIEDEAIVSALLRVFRTSTDDDIRAEAIIALGKVSQGDKEVVSTLIQAIQNDSYENVRINAAYSLGNLGEAAKDTNKLLIQILQDKKQNNRVRAGSAFALGKVDPLNRKVFLALLAALQDENGEVRYYTGAALTEVAQALHSNIKTLQQADHAIGNIAEIKNSLKNPEFTEFHQSVSLTLENSINKKKNLLLEITTRWVTDGRNIWIGHAVFWFILIFAYPKFPQIQAIFFWNPWIRKVFGAGYVGFLLTWVPFLRQKLFEPFQSSLLADASLENFNPQAYFPESEVKVKGAEQTQAIAVVLPAIQSQIVLEGDSGLGKSMFLRHLVQRSQRIVVYLPAQKCDKGVIEAIQAKLHGHVQDAEFLKNLIYSGAIDICIDGLNEVTADTRAKITQFVECYFKGNVIMTTQPLEWTPPSTAKTYVLQPLQRDQIERYLISRQPLMNDAKVQGKDYEQACLLYLATALTDQQPAEELAAAQRILSNPMDLTIVAKMLATGTQPNLLRLQEQLYQLMAEEYQQMWKQEFPLKKFSEAVYQMRLKDEKALPAEEFYKEVLCMEDEKFKMVVSRQWLNTKGEPMKEWYFRHDKIAEFFIVQTFLGEDAEVADRLKTHMSDPRFRGVYFLLATLLPLDAAQELREDLIQYAADTKDHTVSDTFVQLLRSRQAVLQTQAV